jgi:hypothetical protein
LCLKTLEGGVHKGIRTNRARPRFHYGFYLYPGGSVENLAGKKAEDNVVVVDNDFENGAASLANSMPTSSVAAVRGRGTSGTLIRYV